MASDRRTGAPEPQQPRADGSTLNSSAEPNVPAGPQIPRLNPYAEPYEPLHSRYVLVPMPPLICLICTTPIDLSYPHILLPCYHGYHFLCAMGRFPSAITPCISYRPVF